MSDDPMRGAPVAEGPWFYCLKHHTVDADAWEGE